MHLIIRNKILLLVILLFFGIPSFPQATTSSLSGRVTADDQLLPGATVIATHLPSGSQYSTLTNAEGYYHLKGMRPGGPYRIYISYVGYRRLVSTDLQLQLGETHLFNATLKPATFLDEVVVKSNPSSLTSIKTGASSRISSSAIQLFPNISRNLTDLVKLSPYALGSGFAGRDQRMNNFSVDGANFNNNMGLDGRMLPGGGNPISIDAIEEIRIGIAPYDVKQSNFIGGAVNVKTKSGTNTFKGSAYTYLKNENMRGNSVKDYHLGEREKDARTVYGLSLGGPLVKNKLFFFVNGEFEHQPAPIHRWSLSTDGQGILTDKISRVTDEDMSRFSADLKQMYGYDTGSWTDFDGNNNSYRLMARLDFNISDNHKLMLRYNHVDNRKDMNVVGPALGISGHPVSLYSMTFRNSTWQQIDKVNSLTAEFNSRLKPNLHHQLLLSLTLNEGNKRKCNGEFPTVDILKPDEAGVQRAFMNAGYDQHAWHNGISEKVWSITDNFSFSITEHDLTAGFSFESQKASNCYMRYGAGYYRYASYEDFVQKEAPVAFALTYSLTGRQDALAEIHYEQLSFYLQDEWNIHPRLQLLYGIRMDIPFYISHRYENPSIAGMKFNGTQLSTAYWPESTPIFSPRLGFHVDLSGDRTLELRGGTGLFTGRFPLIFLSKMQEGSGMLQTTVSTTRQGDPLLSALKGGIRSPHELLNDIAPQFPDRFPREPGAVNSIVTIDRHFKMPQVWKSSLALDYRLPFAFPALLTLEGTFIRDVYSIVQQDKNIDETKISRFAGPDKRNFYPGKVEKRIDRDINYAILMTNGHKGYSANFNATADLTPLPNLHVMAAYTFTASKTLTSNKSNQIDGAWQQEPSVQGPNYQTLHNAQYLSSPHRIIAQLSYTTTYARSHLSTSFSLFYEGQRAGTFSYLYDGDMNNDGVSYDLIYIPRNREELNFTDKKSGDKTFTAEEQREAFWKFIDQDEYLRKHKGEYAKAHGAYLPWLHRFNVRITQDFKLKIGKQANTLRLSADILNIGNLLNDSWGLTKGASSSNGADLLHYTGVNEQGEPVYTLSTISENGETILPYKTFMENRSPDNCWQLQIGLHYIFN